MGKFKPGDWVIVNDELWGACQLVSVFPKNLAFSFKENALVWIDNLTPARPRVELKNGKVWKIHHPNPYAKWARAIIQKTNKGDYCVAVALEEHFTSASRNYTKRSNAISGLVSLCMSKGINFEVENE